MQGTPRTFFWVAASVGTALWTGALLAVMFLAGSPLALKPMLPLAGIAGFVFGAAVTLMSVTTSELFGLRYFAANYAVVQIAPMLATFVFPTGIVGALYDAEAQRQHPGAVGGSDLECVGGTCFSRAFGILFVLSLAVRPRTPCHKPTYAWSRPIACTCMGCLRAPSVPAFDPWICCASSTVRTAVWQPTVLQQLHAAAACCRTASAHHWYTQTATSLSHRSLVLDLHSFPQNSEGSGCVVSLHELHACIHSAASAYMASSRRCEQIGHPCTDINLGSQGLGLAIIMAYAGN